MPHEQSNSEGSLLQVAGRVQGAAVPQIKVLAACSRHELRRLCPSPPFDDEGNPTAIHDKTKKGQFRCAGDSFMEYGFQLSANPKAKEVSNQQGHFMCLVEFEAAGSDVHLK